ncbi:MAG: cytochrome c maturation protein CcmE [Gemmatimonadales bacterium]|nr:MAG: cytochrome c maturation protein CcmE [Gemmatimonadales bacterium]
MRRDRRFFAGLVGVTAVVTWLIWTGISDTMVYYLTPSELLARAETDELFQERGVKVSGNVVPGTVSASSEELLHTFMVMDPDHPDVQITVHFRHPLPDTFNEEAEVVMDGRYRGDGIFEASEVLTKCGSRYEAMPEEADYATAGTYDTGADPYGAYGDPVTDGESEAAATAAYAPEGEQGAEP